MELLILFIAGFIAVFTIRQTTSRALIPVTEGLTQPFMFGTTKLNRKVSWILLGVIYFIMWSFVAAFNTYGLLSGLAATAFMVLTFVHQVIPEQKYSTMASKRRVQIASAVALGIAFIEIF